MFAFAKNIVKQIEQQAESIIAPESPGAPGNSSLNPEWGFRVLHVEEKSSADGKLEPFFDYIVGINGGPIPLTESNNASSNPYTAPSFLVGSTAPEPDYAKLGFSNDPLNLTVFSAKGHTTRNVALHPPLGATVQWAPLSSCNYVWHVLSVAPNSPAADAGLLADSDYILDIEGGLLAAGGENLLSSVVLESYNNSPGQPLRLYVYNHDHDIVRVVQITPRKDWGGRGLLGCNIGYGGLHCIPESRGVAPGAPFFDAGELVAVRPRKTKKGGDSDRKKEKAAELEQYFLEEEEKSRKNDHLVQSTTANPPPPPPPKAS